MSSMVENKEKFFLYDRWFYLIEEREDIVLYSSKRDILQGATTLVFDKKTNEIKIKYSLDNKKVGELVISDISSDIVNCKYTPNNLEPIHINGNEYLQLKQELFASYKKGERPDYQIQLNKVGKVKNINFPLGTPINLNEIKAYSKPITTFIDIVNALPLYDKKIEQILIAPIKTSEIVDNSVEEIKELYIPQELMIYDGLYKLVEETKNKYIYQNKEEKISTIEVRINPSDVSIVDVKIKDGDVFQILPDDKGGIIARYTGRGIKNLVINNNLLSASSINTNVIYDSKRNLVENVIEMKIDKKSYRLERHPKLCRIYIDDQGKEYTLSSSSLFNASGILSYAPNIFNGIEKKMIKKKDK